MADSPLYTNPRSPKRVMKKKPLVTEEAMTLKDDGEETKDQLSGARQGTDVPDEVMHKLGQFNANVGRDMPMKWKAIKTVGIKT